MKIMLYNLSEAFTIVNRQHACAQELKSYLRKGITLDELWRVARGEVKYAEFTSSQQNGNGAAAVAAPPSVPR